MGSSPFIRHEWKVVPVVPGAGGRIWAEMDLTPLFSWVCHLYMGGVLCDFRLFFAGFAL